LEFPDFCRDCGNGNRESATIAVVTRRAPLPRMVVFRFDTARWSLLTLRGRVR
jgi:hypothetical protein